MVEDPFHLGFGVVADGEGGSLGIVVLVVDEEGDRVDVRSVGGGDRGEGLSDGVQKVVSEGHGLGFFPLVPFADLGGVGGPVAGGGALPGGSDADVDAEQAGEYGGGQVGGELEQAAERDWPE